MIEITDKSKCCGCGACSNICPTQCINMDEDEEGFLYPIVDKAGCNQCELCLKVCPILNCQSEKAKEQKAFLVRINNEVLCKESTSGGAFSAIAQSVIQQNGVVFGAAFDPQFEVYHTYAETEKQLKHFRNSKYVQSRTEDCYQRVKEFLKSGKLVLYSGTPCQIEGLNNFIGGSKENLILVDLVCRAVPSPLVWRKYKEYCKPQENSKLIDAAFRDKSQFGYQYSQMKMAYSDGSVLYSGVESDPYLRAFFSNLSDRPSCYDCMFKKRHRVSDLTIWDCFDVYRIDNQFDDNKGVTRILAHSGKGADVILKLKNSTVVEIEPEIAVVGVKELVESVVKNPKRSIFFKDCNQMDTMDFICKWFPDSIKVKLNRLGRFTFEKLGVYRQVKRVVRVITGKEKLGGISKCKK